MACYSYSIQERGSKKVLTVASASVKAAGLTRDYAERFSKSSEDTYYCQTRQRPEVLEQEIQEVDESTVPEVVRGLGFSGQDPALWLHSWRLFIDITIFRGPEIVPPSSSQALKTALSTAALSVLPSTTHPHVNPFSRHVPSCRLLLGWPRLRIRP
jgi:hypothetical protein